MRTPLIAGNWKMHKTASEAVALVTDLLPRLAGRTGVEVIVAPPFTSLGPVGQALVGSSVRLAAQNMHWESKGAFTGEVSAPMLRDLGVSHVILGHSERRQYFGETDEVVARKVAAALAAGLTPILCVGETLQERDRGEAFRIVARQVAGSLEAVAPGNLENLVLAYEPVWAIGTGRTATTEQAQEMHAHIRARLAELGGTAAASRTRVLYGGSVKPDNIAGLMAKTDVDGALVGGASLEAETFASIVGFRV